MHKTSRALGLEIRIYGNLESKLKVSKKLGIMIFERERESLMHNLINTKH